jgi:hypothetical protein
MVPPLAVLRSVLCCGPLVLNGSLHPNARAPFDGELASMECSDSEFAPVWVASHYLVCPPSNKQAEAICVVDSRVQVSGCPVAPPTTGMLG